jgi:DNA primase
MNNYAIIRLLNALLGKGYELKNNEVSYHCPFCNHHKKKLQVNISSQFWQCWVCGVKGRKIISLLKKISAPYEYFKKLSNLLGDRFEPLGNKKYSDDLSLPIEYIAFKDANTKSPEYKNAIYYLIKRGLTPQDIFKYSIGYCESGPYRGMIIIPSYDENGKLNFFTGRSYYDTNYKHKNPSVSKNIIGFDLHINWDEPITLVEGAFDAIAVRRNAIPLFGKLLSDKLKIKIIKKQVSQVNIALDRDALKGSLKISQYLMSNGIDVHFIDLPEKDPSELGFENIQKLISNSMPLNLLKMMEFKLLC